MGEGGREGLEGGGRREEWKMKRKRVKHSTSAAFSELRRNDIAKNRSKLSY